MHESAKTSTSEEEEMEKEQNPSPVISANPRHLQISTTHRTPALGARASSSSPKSGKIAGARESGGSLLKSVNRSVSQIRKHSPRKSGSPVNWYPRKKGDSYLQRKIKHLQEVGGMNLSLDETLCGANLHYSRIAREKIAATQAANRAMEARRAAMVEASWCGILKAARIQSKDAEEELSKAEKRLSEALEAAVALGVMMYDRPGSQSWSHKVETSLGKGGKSTHTITASFETAFEVEKEVAIAIKKAYLRLANCNSSNKDEFKDLLHKISENPDDEEMTLELHPESQTADYSPCGDDTKRIGTPLGQRRRNSRGKNSRAFAELVDAMFNRLKCLQEDELSSLATIVATCGLNAALVENGTCKYQGSKSGSNWAFDLSITCDRPMPTVASLRNRRYSIPGLMQGYLRREGTGARSVGLDKYLVKHLSRLEGEIQEARNLRKVNQDNETGDALKASEQEIPQSQSSNVTSESIPGLDVVLEENVVSGLEKDIQAAKSFEQDKSELVAQSACVRESDQMSTNRFNKGTKELSKTCADKINQENSACVPNDLSENAGGHSNGALDKEVPKACLHRVKPDKENIDLNVKFAGHKFRGVVTKEDRGKAKFSNRPPPFQKHASWIQRANKEVDEPFSAQEEQLGLDKILMKPIHRLDRMKKQVQEEGWDVVPKLERKKHELEVTSQESLDKVLVRHVSRLEKEKLEALQANKVSTAPERRRGQDPENKEASLDEILVKRPSRLQTAKLASAVQPEDPIKCSSTRREARERELQEAWGGLSLGNSLKPSLSRLEREKAAWRKAEEEEKKQTVQI